MKQDKFLNNDKNITQFINIFKEKLIATKISVKQAKHSADVIFVNTAWERYHTNYKMIAVGEDVDLLVLLIAKSLVDGKGNTDIKCIPPKL